MRTVTVSRTLNRYGYTWMVLYRRRYVTGGTFFFTLALADRGTDLLVRHIKMLGAAFREAHRVRPFRVDAIAVLPEHLHTVITLPPGDAGYPTRWRSIKASFSRSLAAAGVPLARNRRGECGIWQRRYWEHAIRDHNDLAAHIDYIHFNPVKHGLAGSPLQWPHSSFGRYVRAGVVPADWGGTAHSAPGGGGEPK